MASKTISCPVCFYHEALMENEKAAPNTPEFMEAIYCPACESGLNDLDNPILLTPYQEEKLKVIQEEAPYVSHRINPCDWGNVLEVRVEKFVHFKNEIFMKANCNDYVAYLIFEEQAPPMVKMRLPS